MCSSPSVGFQSGVFLLTSVVPQEQCVRCVTCPQGCSRPEAPSDPQTLRPSDPQTLRPSDPQTLRLLSSAMLMFVSDTRSPDVLNQVEGLWERVQHQNQNQHLYTSAQMSGKRCSRYFT
ncbi:hypothetical protein EYF80_035091 [Liparis tanakae]|uniref:Uncharacterized protein n=1 Tax=Liparis tanakae TaxID=230148 RepID=A0A4Z2GM44_9TELE|nr:hypothetical protein EYF80_035091 [Liparis tanakae]